MEEGKDIILQQIANHLLINSSFLTDLSLFHGKTGIVLFFYKYAQYTNNPVYEEFAGELLDELFKEIHDGIGVDFEHGLSGIGWGVLYLLKNKFIAGNPAEILEDIDMRIMEVNLLRIRNSSLERGISGIAIYLSYRLSFADVTSPFDSAFLSDLQKVISDKAIHTDFDLYFFINQCTHSSVEGIKRTLLGLQNGYAGYGLKWITV